MPVMKSVRLERQLSNAQYEELLSYVTARTSEVLFTYLERTNAKKMLSLLRKQNQYAYITSKVDTVHELVDRLIMSRLVRGNSNCFGPLFESIMLRALELRYGARASDLDGIDVEFLNDGVLYLVQIKTASLWGNAGSRYGLQMKFADAKRQRESEGYELVECYEIVANGKVPKRTAPGYTRLEGQQAWNFITGRPNFFVEMIEPMRRGSPFNHDSERNALTHKVYVQLYHLIAEKLADTSGNLDHAKMVRWASENI